MPAERETEAVVEFGALAGSDGELLEAADEEFQVAFASSCGVEPAAPGDVGFDVGIFFKQRDKARPSGSHGAFFFIVGPCDLNFTRDAASEPAGRFKA